MRSRTLAPSEASLVGLSLGLLAGAAAGLLIAPVRGDQMRANLRSRADLALERGMRLLEDGRRALRARGLADDYLDVQPATSRATRAAEPPVLTATLGELAQMHELLTSQPLQADGREGARS